jgi:hypothetical protein
MVGAIWQKLLIWKIPILITQRFYVLPHPSTVSCICSGGVPLPLLILSQTFIVSKSLDDNVFEESKKELKPVCPSTFLFGGDASSFDMTAILPTVTVPTSRVSAAPRVAVVPAVSSIYRVRFLPDHRPTRHSSGLCFPFVGGGKYTGCIDSSCDRG